MSSRTAATRRQRSKGKWLMPSQRRCRQILKRDRNGRKPNGFPDPLGYRSTLVFSGLPGFTGYAFGFPAFATASKTSFIHPDLVFPAAFAAVSISPISDWSNRQYSRPSREKPFGSSANFPTTNLRSFHHLSRKWQALSALALVSLLSLLRVALP